MNDWITKRNVGKSLKVYNTTAYTYRQLLLKKLSTFLKSQ